MNLDEYRDKMADAHREFQNAVLKMLTAYGRVQTVFTDVINEVSVGFMELKESNDELRKLVLEQGVELRALRDRLNGGESA